MARGFLYGNRRDVGLTWLPADARYPGLIYSEEKIRKQGGLTFGRGDYLHVVRISAYICKKCRRCVFSTDQ